MSKRTAQDSPLVAAAQAFDDELSTYARLAELLLKSPLTTAKHLERANQTIDQISQTEDRLGVTGRGLAVEIAGARDHQQQLADQLIAYLPSVHARNLELRAVVDELGQIAESTRELNALATGGEAAVLEVEDKLTALADRAEGLAGRARATGFEELASQAHAVHQQLVAAGRKLKTVTSRMS